MFQSSLYGNRKEDKICSISDFQSSSESFAFVGQQSIIANKVIDLVKESSHHRIRYKPVYIISPNFTTKHINMLTLLLQKYGIPIQYQHETDSLGEEVNTTFFVVVDNKAGSLALGNQFNSELITVIGYPKKGNNKRNIYCSQPQQVYKEYMMFTERNSRTGYEKQLDEKLRKLDTGNKKQERRGSIFGCENSNIKLKSISKYDNSRERSGLKQSIRNMVSDGVKGEVWNKQNVQSKQRIDLRQCQKKSATTGYTSNLHILQSATNKPYNLTIQTHYNHLKSSIQHQSPITLHQTQPNLIQTLTPYLNQPTKPHHYHYIIISHQMALKLATRINSQLYTIKSMIRLVVGVIVGEGGVQGEGREGGGQLLVVQKAMKSQLFWLVVCGVEELGKVIDRIGVAGGRQAICYEFKQDNAQLKTDFKSSNKPPISSKSSLSISQDDMISFCPDNKQAQSLFKTIDKNCSTKIQKSSRLHPLDKKGISHPNIIPNNHEISAVLPKQHQNSRVQEEIKPKSKIKIIPAINSMLSPGKSSVSSKSSGSKIRFLKVIKKSNIMSQNNSQLIKEVKYKNLADTNSQYCIDKNRGIVERLQSRIEQSRRSISIGSRKSLKSIQNNGSERSIPRQESVGCGRKAGNVRWESRKLIKDSRNDQLSGGNGSDRGLKNQQQKLRKLKMSVDQNKDFVAQCSQLSFSSDYQTSQRKIQSSTSGNTQKQVKRKVSSQMLQANEYYFGVQNAISPKWQAQQTFPHHHSIFSGLLYIQYNSLIGEIITQFRADCPQRFIQQKNMRRFYLAREYSRELRRLWSGKMGRGVLPVLVDLQGLGEVVKYYQNVMFDDDEMGFCSKVSQQQNSASKNPNNFTSPQNSAILLSQFPSDNCPIIIFFTIVTEQQQQHCVFDQLDLLQKRLPRHEVIKCVIKEQVLNDDNLLRQKSRQIYQQMMGYFTQLSEQYGERVIGTV